MEAIMGVVASLLSVALVVLNRVFAANDARTKAMGDASATLAKALAEGRITDAAAAHTALENLRKGAAVLAIACCLLFAGCATPAQPPLVIGERILKTTPGQTLVVPPLVAPARQWYVVDDVGLQQWLGIVLPDPSATRKDPVK